MLHERNTATLKFPTHYPKNCPPKDADDAHGIVYRLVDCDPPQKHNFKSVYELTGKKKRLTPNQKNCGLSVQRSIKDIKKLKENKALVRGLRKRLIARGKLNPALGKIKHTGNNKSPSHHTWWVPLGAEPWLVFEVIDEDKDEDDKQ